MVVPSPASLTVCWAACFNSVAPIFSIGFLNVILFATVTPSLVTIGLPLLSSSITHLPPAPSVDRDWET